MNVPIQPETIIRLYLTPEEARVVAVAISIGIGASVDAISNNPTPEIRDLTVAFCRAIMTGVHTREVLASVVEKASDLSDAVGQLRAEGIVQ